MVVAKRACNRANLVELGFEAPEEYSDCGFLPLPTKRTQSNAHKMKATANTFPCEIALRASPLMPGERFVQPTPTLHCPSLAYGPNHMTETEIGASLVQMLGTLPSNLPMHFPIATARNALEIGGTTSGRTSASQRNGGTTSGQTSAAQRCYYN